MKRSIFKAIFVLGLALLGVAAPSAVAQQLPYPGRVRVLTKTFDPTNPGKAIEQVAYDNSSLLGDVLNGAWQASRATISDQIIAQMSRGDSLGRGLTPYNITCNMGEKGELLVAPGEQTNGSTLAMSYVVRGNYIEFTTTQPTSAGKWADPRFSCTYDLTLSLAMTINDGPQPLHMTSVKAQLSNAKIDSHGLIGDLVFVGNAVTKMFGSDYIKRAQNAIDGKNYDFTDKLNQGLAPFNTLASHAGSLVQSAVSVPGNNRRPQLMMVMRKDAPIATRGPGTISGVIRWKKSVGSPDVGALGRAFSIQASVQSGFPDPLLPPMTRVGVLQSVSSDPSLPPNGDEYGVRYTIGQLPLNLPIKVSVQLTRTPWQGNVGDQVRDLNPPSQPGITLKPNQQTAIAPNFEVIFTPRVFIH